ncbi:hypothetical protein FB451DRAFT_1174497 [Mycena latifolia]|nr:hypothetical protein FB451DRAFT_1174497 [Mycena latifolia]
MDSGSHTSAVIGCSSVGFPSSPRKAFLKTPAQGRVCPYSGRIIRNRAHRRHTLAHQYVELGVKGVCVVSRRADKFSEVVAECNACKRVNTEVVGITGDFAEVEDMSARFDMWGGINTMIVAASMSALRPLMEVAGAQSGNVGIQHVVDVAGRATCGNYVGPLVAAVAFIGIASPLPQSCRFVMKLSATSLSCPPHRRTAPSLSLCDLALSRSSCPGSWNLLAISNGPPH